MAQAVERIWNHVPLGHCLKHGNVKFVIERDGEGGRGPGAPGQRAQRAESYGSVDALSVDAGAGQAVGLKGLRVDFALVGQLDHSAVAANLIEGGVQHNSAHLH